MMYRCIICKKFDVVEQLKAITSDEKISICDYADTDYAADFWNGSIDRTYEDLTERALLQRLLPESGESIIDIGAGFGRLTTEYKDKFKRCVLLDYADNLLKQAREKYKLDNNIEYIKASCYEIPLDDNSFDFAVSFRLLHHIQDVDKYFNEVYRVIKPGGRFILEVANKKNILEILRYFSGKSDKQPFSLSPYCYGENVYYNFHPNYVKLKARKTGFQVVGKYSISNFRFNIMKKTFNPRILAALDKLLGRSLGSLDFGPSIIFNLIKK
ncbi:MAG: class I SAM-dependent methyltransferase [Candidatus Margulisiibacteriota bacterium]